MSLNSIRKRVFNLKEFKNELEHIQMEISVTKDLTRLLEQHFEVQREPKNITLDWYSLRHLFNEYTTLSYVISTKLENLERRVNKVVQIAYERSRNNETEIN